jgi:hypothetical protein
MNDIKDFDENYVGDEKACKNCNVQDLIAQECNTVKNLLLDKNSDYGSSFAEPINIFAKNISAEDQLNVRIDDKIKRLKTAQFKIKEDTELDLIGYLILKRVLNKYLQYRKSIGTDNNG